MYVCVCQAVTNRQISASIAQGARTFHDLRQQLGVATCCGKCSEAVRTQLSRECRGCAGGCGKSCACGG